MYLFCIGLHGHLGILVYNIFCNSSGSVVGFSYTSGSYTCVCDASPTSRDVAFINISKSSTYPLCSPGRKRINKVFSELQKKNHVIHEHSRGVCGCRLYKYLSKWR